MTRRGIIRAHIFYIYFNEMQLFTSRLISCDGAEYLQQNYALQQQQEPL